MNRPKLFCFTYAGGTADFFQVIQPDLEGIDVIALDYAGHGTRFKEPFCQSLEEVAEELFEKLKDQMNGTYALFGYSMGSIVTVEVLRRIIAAGLPQPTHIFLAAHEPDTKVELQGFTADEMDELVKERTLRFGGVPEKLANNRVFWRMYLPLYRADYSMIGAYDFDALDLESRIPATIFYSETDTPKSDMERWQRFFPCTYQEYDGTHFFIEQHHQEMGQLIRSRMGL